jgi:hypothetical protein
MSAQAHRDRRGVPQAGLRLVASRSTTGRARQAMQTADTIVGHRLADGRIWTHAPSQPCHLCDAENAENAGRHPAQARR